MLLAGFGYSKGEMSLHFLLKDGVDIEKFHSVFLDQLQQALGPVIKNAVTLRKIYKNCSSDNEMCVRQSWILYQKLCKVRIINFINSVNIYSSDRF